KPTLPMPSNSPGRVLGFQIPARNTCALPVFAMRWALDTTCSSVSALHGPAMTKGLPRVLIQEINGAMSNECFIIVVLNFCGFGKLIPSPCMLCFYFFVFTLMSVCLLNTLIFDVLTHDAEVYSMFEYFANCSIIVCLFLPLYVHVEVVFITASYDRHGLNFAEIDVLLGKTLQYIGQGADSISGLEGKRGFIGSFLFNHFIAQNEEARCVFFIGLYSTFQNF